MSLASISSDLILYSFGQGINSIKRIPYPLGLIRRPVSSPCRIPTEFFYDAYKSQHRLLWNRDDISRYVLICTSYTLNCTITDFNQGFLKILTITDSFPQKTSLAQKRKMHLPITAERRVNYLQQSLYVHLVYNFSGLPPK